jgi:putative transposase
VIEAMRKLSGQYPRFGSRRIRVMLARQGIVLGKERCARRCGPRRVCKYLARGAGGGLREAGPGPCAGAARNAVWCYDFVFDACANRQQLKCLTLVDEYTRECLAIDVAGSIRSRRVIDVLSRLISVHGAPRYIRSDNGPEFVSTALMKWALEQQIETAFIDPGKPWQNGTNESFNGKFRTSAWRWNGSVIASRPGS